MPPRNVLAARLGLALALALSAPIAAHAQSAQDHTSHMMHAGGADHGRTAPGATASPTEPGQAAFAAIAEIVRILRSDPGIDWRKVRIETLRQHLIDMDNVTMRARVTARDVESGARFVATSTAPDVTASIRRMVAAHAATMTSADGMAMQAEQVEGGASLQVTGPDPAMIRGLGLIGLLTVGMHHQAHHLALARGEHPHGH